MCVCFVKVSLQATFASRVFVIAVCLCLCISGTHTHSQPVREHALKPQEAKLVRQTGSCHQQLSSPAYQVEATKQSIAMKDNEIAADKEKRKEEGVWGRGSAY